MDERTQLLESLHIEIPTEQDVDDDELAMYMTMMEGTNTLIDECLKLKREAKENKEKLNAMAKGLESIADEESGDVIFKLKRGTTRAHSSVVSSWSEPLEKMLQSGMCEGRNKCIEIATEEPLFVRMLLKYFYTGRAPINLQTSFPLLRLSCLYGVDTLRNECCTFLLDNINVENCIPIMNIADLHQIEGLQMWENLKVQSKEFSILNFPAVVAVNNSPLSEMNIPRIVEYFESAIPILLQNEGANVAENAKLLSLVVVNWAKEVWHVSTLPHVIMQINSEIANYKMQIFVKTSGNTLSVFIKKTSSVYDLKVALEKSSGIPIEVQRLTFEGKVISDAESLSECQILTDCTVHLSVTQPPKKAKVTGGDVDAGPVGEVDYLEDLRANCILILAADFAAQSRTYAFLEFDYETFLSIMTQDSLATCEENIVLNSAYAWVNASLDRNTPKIINQLATCGCPQLVNLTSHFEPQRKKKRNNDCMRNL